MMKSILKHIAPFTNPVHSSQSRSTIHSSYGSKVPFSHCVIRSMSSVTALSGVTDGSSDSGTKRKESDDAMDLNKKERLDERDGSSGRVVSSCTEKSPSNHDPDASIPVVQSLIQPDLENDEKVSPPLDEKVCGTLDEKVSPSPDETEEVFKTFPLAESPVRKKPDTWVKKFKHAVLLSYSGSGYHGLQRITGSNALPSVEEDVLRAFLHADLIDLEEYKHPGRLLHFQRAARTDKGVSAARQILSLKLPRDIHSSISTVNTLLPHSIRVMGVIKTTKFFDSKNYCDARTYTYMMPTFALTPFDQAPTTLGDRVTQTTQKTLEDGVTQKTLGDGVTQTTLGDGVTQTTQTTLENGVTQTTDATLENRVRQGYRVGGGVISDYNQVLELFKGTHNYHNFTSQKDARDASACRYIMSVEASDPFLRGGMEWTVVRVKGQSFMLHQIRKMIGLSIAVMKGFASLDTLKRSFSLDRIDVPKAPGLGLMLEQVHYDKYNRRYGGDGLHEPITWDSVNEQVSQFKEEVIHAEIVRKEREENSMFEWLKTLSFHTYDTILPGPRNRRGSTELSVFGKIHFAVVDPQGRKKEDTGGEKEEKEGEKEKEEKN